jgi:hypothetical protein
VRSDPARVLREYCVAPLRADLLASGASVLVVRGADAVAELRATTTRFDAAWVELERLASSDAEALARDVARVLCAGAQIICLVPGGTPLLPSLRLALRRDGDAGAWRERRAAAAAWHRVLDPLVEWRRRRGLCILVPPGRAWPHERPLVFGLLAAAEHLVRSSLPFRELGVWSLLEGVRR